MGIILIIYGTILVIYGAKTGEIPSQTDNKPPINNNPVEKPNINQI